MTTEEKVDAIMNDIRSRKGLGKLWDDYWEYVDERTREAITDAWAKIINE